MSAFRGHPGLARLARLELRAALRRNARRLRTPSGIFFALVGAVVATGWIWAVLFSPHEGGTRSLSGPQLLPLVQAGLCVLLVVTLLSAWNARGIYLPRGHVERLLAAPVEQADLVRYRMHVDLARSLFGAIVFALLALRRLPSPFYGFLGVLLAVMSMTIVRQFAAVTLVALERWVHFCRRGSTARILTRILIVLLVWLLVDALIMGEGFLHGLSEEGSPAERIAAALGHPLARIVLAPTLPWARAITATSATELVRWGGAALALGLVLFEWTARIPIDLRQATLDTSADVARRLATLRRGGGPLAGFDEARGKEPGRLPWLFGRSPFGAVAWAQAVAIRRKAMGTLLLSLLVVGIVTVFASALVRGGGPRASLGGAAIIGLGGTVYLASGLRFDFRSSLDRLETLKSWPLHPARLFLATILPQVALISGILAIAVVLRGLVTGTFHPILLGAAAVLPLVVLSWVALDNAVFLLAPVRFVPGQEGALHHMGRTMVLVLLRLLLFGLVSLVVGAGVLVIGYGGMRVLEWPQRAVEIAAVLFGVLVLAGLDAALVALGGALLARFDVSREIG